MKNNTRFLTILLCILLLFAFPTALAEEEETTIDITFEGEYIAFEDVGFQLYLPTDWISFDTQEHYYEAGTEDETQKMAIDILDTEGKPLLDIAQEVAEQDGIENVSMITINGIAFAVYEAPTLNGFGAFANTPEDAYCIHIIFAPHGDEAFQSLATQIMASIGNLE